MVALGVDFDEAVIELRDVTRRFGSTLALDRVNLRVPRGAVFGLVGENGAGKTTLIRHVLGLLRAQSGSVWVLGLDPVADPAGVLGRVGYLSEENDLPAWMRVAELMRYSRAFYPAWDDAYADELRQTFELSPGAHVGTLSKGQRARAGLLVALAHRPELLVLDEPSSGLDPLVRRDILEAIIRTIAEEGRTVVFSSHLLDEVERVSDHVALIQHGRMVFSSQLDHLKETHCCLTLRFSEPRSQPPALAGVLAWQGAGYEWTAVCRRRAGELASAIADSGGLIVADRVPSLDEIFMAQVGNSAGAGQRRAKGD
jgi:ABC-2 type transport system ATP-binding protein